MSVAEVQMPQDGGGEGPWGERERPIREAFCSSGTDVARWECEAHEARESGPFVRRSVAQVQMSQNGDGEEVKVQCLYFCSFFVCLFFHILAATDARDHPVSTASIGHPENTTNAD